MHSSFIFSERGQHLHTVGLVRSKLQGVTGRFISNYEPASRAENFVGVNDTLTSVFTIPVTSRQLQHTFLTATPSVYLDKPQFSSKHGQICCKSGQHSTSPAPYVCHSLVASSSTPFSEANALVEPVVHSVYSLLACPHAKHRRALSYPSQQAVPGKLAIAIANEEFVDLAALTGEPNVLEN